jgi:hypothetical protein
MRIRVDVVAAMVAVQFWTFPALAGVTPSPVIGDGLSGLAALVVVVSALIGVRFLRQRRQQ